MHFALLVINYNTNTFDDIMENYSEYNHSEWIEDEDSEEDCPFVPKYDYYQLGGRFGGLPLKNVGEKPTSVAYKKDVQWKSSEPKKLWEAVDKFWNGYVLGNDIVGGKAALGFKENDFIPVPNYYLGQIESPENLYLQELYFMPYAILDGRTGKWIDSEDYTIEDWYTKVRKKYITSIPSDTVVALVDCHI